MFFPKHIRSTNIEADDNEASLLFGELARFVDSHQTLSE